MRDIRFRAWDKVNNKMLSHKDMLDGSWDNWPTLFFAITDNDIYIPMQFTGLHDSQGKEIYEGDVVYFYLEGTPEDDYGNAEIVFSDGSFCVKHKIGELRIDKEEVFNEYPFFVIDFTQVEIIGNIYENHELIGK